MASRSDELRKTLSDLMAGRVIAIGDILGCSLALCSLIDVVQPDSADTVVTLGDYVNRGPDGQGVVNQLINLRDRFSFFPLLGNQDQLLLLNRFSNTEIPGHQLTDEEEHQCQQQNDRTDIKRLAHDSRFNNVAVRYQ